MKVKSSISAMSLDQPSVAKTMIFLQAVLITCVVHYKANKQINKNTNKQTKALNATIDFFILYQGSKKTLQKYPELSMTNINNSE